MMELDSDACYSRCGLRISTIVAPRDPLAMQNLGPTPSLLNQNLHFKKNPRELLWTLKFTWHCRFLVRLALSVNWPGGKYRLD